MAEKAKYTVSRTDAATARDCSCSCSNTVTVYYSKAQAHAQKSFRDEPVDIKVLEVT